MAVSAVDVSPQIIQDGNVGTILPQGKYTLVSIDVDTTGRRLIDEIVQLAAFTPKDSFQQYIMPYMNLNPAARQRHQLRVISIGFYRMMKSMRTFKIIKSKSEIAAVKDFLTWLEQIKAKDLGSQGVILMYYEERKFIPYMILESLKKYNLLDRFCSSVKFFVNGAKLAKAQDNQAFQRCSLRKLSTMLTSELEKSASGTSVSIDVSASSVINAAESTTANENETSDLLKNDRDIFEGSAKVRAKLAYKVAYLLCNRGCDLNSNSTEALVKLIDGVQKYAQPIESDLKELEDQSEILERQNSFRPVFLLYFKATLFHRVRAVKFRIILAERGFDLNALHAIWKEKQKNGIVDVLKDIEEIKATDKAELADLFDSFFDPNKTTLKPTVRNRRDNRRDNRPVANTTNGGDNTARGNAGGEANRTDRQAGGDKKQQSNSGEVPDSTTKTPNRPNNFRKQQRNRRTADRNNLTKSKKLPILNANSAAASINTAAPMAVVAVN